VRVGFSVPPLSSRFVQFAYASGGQSTLPSGGAGILQVSGTSVMLSITSMSPAGQPAVVGFRGLFNVTSGGTFRVQFAGVASTAQSPVTLMPGSYMMCHRLK
jgi:hypothetical protein